ncbi:MAG TPA: rhomboid family intramembrane serine protease [Ideonella sp.]|nr:rhomboid family intramembrane serine protease [Ideonella sp.]
MPPLPPFTKWLMLVCAAIFLLDQLLGNTFQLGIWFDLWPLDSGMFYPWQLLSYAFLHGSFSHLIFNMLGLWMFGAELERLWGHQRYWQLLLASALTAAGAQLLLTYAMGSHVPTVGASGAVYGLLLAYALMFPRRQFDLVGFLPMALVMIPGQIFYTIGVVLFVLLLTNRQAVPIRPIPIPALTMVMIYGAIELVLGVAYSRSGIAHIAHLGGMLGGWLMIRYWRGQAPFPSRRRR